MASHPTDGANPTVSGRLTAAARYKVLVPTRQPFLDRARTYALLTLPGLMPPQGSSGTTNLAETYQSLGAMLVLHLSSRMLTTFYPPGIKSFRFDVSPEVLLDSGEMKVDKDTEQGLVKAEDIVQSQIESSGWRRPTHMVLQHLIVAGNVMEQMMPNNTIRLFRLDQYVVLREPGGALIEFVVEEKLNPDSVPKDMQSLLEKPASVTGAEAARPRLVSLYTWGKLEDDGWHIHQEIGDARVPDSEGIFPVNPFNALRWSELVAEDYGRGKCEEHIGDLRTVEGLSKAMLEGAAMASRNITMIRPNAAGGLNLRRRLDKAINGDNIVGNPEDVSMLQFENVGGMQFTSDSLQQIAQRLSAAFLSNTGVRRDAERVTAQELRMVAEELEGVLGGVFSMLALDLQKARLTRLIVQMQASGQLPPWPEGVVDPTILTGLEALGRDQDVQKVATMMQLMQGLPPETLDYVKWSELLGKAFNGIGLPNAIRSDAEVQEIREQKLAAQAAINVAQAGGEAAVQAAAAPGPEGQDQPQGEAV